MKKVSLVLGALIVVGLTVQAKEQPMLVAPSVTPEVISNYIVEESIIVAPPIIEKTFRPSGFIGLEYRAYGKTENHGDSIPPTPIDSADEWNYGANDYSRLETSFGVQATEKIRVAGRVRDFNDLEKNDGSKKNNKQGTDTRLRGYYKHNNMFTSRVEYRDTEKNEERYEYYLLYTPYSNPGGILDKVVLAPKIAHRVKANNKNYYNRYGLDLYLTGNLPLGMTWENNYYLNYDKHNSNVIKTVEVSKNDRKKSISSGRNDELTTIIELYLRRSFELYKTENSNLKLNLEVGYDPYVFYQYDKAFVDKKNKTISTYKRTYELRSLVDLSFMHKLTENITAKTGLAAEYRNWDVVAESKAKSWRWQPYVYAGINIKF